MRPLPKAVTDLLAGLRAGQEDDLAKRAARSRQTMERANRKMFERACADAGIDPARGVSPALARLLEQQRAEADQWENADGHESSTRAGTGRDAPVASRSM